MLSPKRMTPLDDWMERWTIYVSSVEAAFALDIAAHTAARGVRGSMVSLESAAAGHA